MTVSPKNAFAGSTVTITVKPDSGYVLETLTVAGKNGKLPPQSPVTRAQFAALLHRYLET